MYQLSVIIPIYNTEAFIERCAKSLFEQTLSSIEYIFVDDASKDASIDKLSAVIEDYPTRKPHIKIIRHEKNLGTLLTKLDGMQAARGKYFIVCDSDDWVDRDAYQCLVDKAEQTNADIVTCNYLKEFGDHSQLCRHDPSPYKRGRDIVAHSYLTGFEWQECTNIFKNYPRLLNSIERIEGICMWDDVYVAILLYYHANKVEHVDRPLYHYDRSYHGSVTENGNIQRWRNQVEIVRRLQGILAGSCDMTLRWLELDTVTSSSLACNPIKWDNAFPGCERYIWKMKLWPTYWRICYIALSHGISFPCKLVSLLKRIASAQLGWNKSKG